MKELGITFLAGILLADILAKFPVELNQRRIDGNGSFDLGRTVSVFQLGNPRRIRRTFDRRRALRLPHLAFGVFRLLHAAILIGNWHWAQTATIPIFLGFEISIATHFFILTLYHI